jgi:hypothetical protein
VSHDPPTRGFDDAAALLDPDVTWQGLRDDWVCHGREEVIETFRRALDERRDVDALEFTRAGEQVVLGRAPASVDDRVGEMDTSTGARPLRDANARASPA